jgi:hypothetical protein
MKVEELLEQMDKNITLLTESIGKMVSYDKSEVKEKYGSRKTYEQCMNLETGALTSMITLRQWIVNKNSLETHLETYEQLVDRSFRKD